LIPHKLLSLIAALDIGEKEEFGAYLGFPPFNTNRKLLDFWKGLDDYAPDYQLGKEDCEKLFEAMWRGRAFDKAEWRNKCSLLKKALLRYLALKESEGKEEEKELNILAQLRRRGLTDLFEQNYRKVKKALHGEEKSVAENQFYLYRLADEANVAFGQSQRRDEDPSLSEKVYHLDRYYLRIRLREACELFNRHELLNSPMDKGLFEGWLEEIILKQKEELDLEIGIYLDIYQCLRNPSEPSYFQRLKEKLFAQADIFPAEEARGLFRHGQNYCIRQIHQGKLSYLEELFLLFDLQLKKEIIFYEGYLDHSDYKNITTVALRLKKYDWVEEFIEGYRERVHPRYRDNVYHFCQASLLDERGESEKAIKLLNEVAFTDVFYQISARMLLIRLYFTREDWEGLYYGLDAFERFLKRNKKLVRSREEGHLGFVKALRQVAKLQERKPDLSPLEFRSKTRALKDKILGRKSVTNLSWILQQLPESKH